MYDQPDEQCEEAQHFINSYNQAIDDMKPLLEYVEKLEVVFHSAERLVERVDFNGGLGEYKGGPAFVMKDIREAINEAKKV